MSGIRALTILLAAGCSCGAAESATTEREGATSSAALDYEVHEWGLLRASAGDVLNAGAIGPPRPVEAISVDKPVLYFHAAAPLRLDRVAVDAHGGTIVEVWPPARALGASRIVWTDVAIDPVGACALSTLPALGDPACTRLAPGDVCEVASLALARAEGSACVRTADGTDTLLFYRERTRELTPPLRFERTSVYDVVDVTNEGSVPIPGWLVRLHDHGGAVRAIAVRPPAPGQRITVGAGFDGAALPSADETSDRTSLDQPALPGSPEPGRQAVRETLRELGLSDQESAAFLRSWDPMLFGLAVGDSRGGMDSVDVLSADGDPAPRESFLYFLPPDACDRVARLELEPPPRAIRRALALWSPLRAAGPSH